MLLGAIAVAAFVCGLYFIRFWHATRDRFFLLFALAFWIEGGHRIAVYRWGGDEGDPSQYLVRLIAYGLIIFAIMDKNRRR